MIPLSVPNFEGNEQKYVQNAVSQGWVSTGGAYVEQLERNISDYTNTPGAVACQSGTAALHLSLLECGIGINDLVIVPTLTFIAAINPVKYVHAEPIFMDCDDSLCIDPIKLQKFCEEECELTEDGLICKSSRGKIKAIIVVHVFGNLADMESIMDIAGRYHLKVIEDATEALGSYYLRGKYKGYMAGSLGDYGAFSFNGNKIITTGGGGIIISHNQKALKHLKYLSTQAKDDPHFYIHEEIGYNYRMTNVQAALGVAQMEELEKFIERKNKNYDLYKKLLAEDSRYHLLDFRHDVRSNKWFYSLVLDKQMLKEKTVEEYIDYLQSQGIQTRPIWGLIHEQKPYKTCLAYKIENAFFYSRHIINIPCSTNITVEEIFTVSNILKQL